MHNVYIGLVYRLEGIIGLGLKVIKVFKNECKAYVRI